MKRIFKGCEINVIKEEHCYKVILNWLPPRKESDLYWDYESNNFTEAMHVAKEEVSQSQLPHLMK